MSSAVRMRASQVAAAAQPSSIRIAIGARVVCVVNGGFHNGPAAAIITSAASRSRSSVSHHGVARRRFFARRDFQKQPGRREIDAARTRRNQPQQPPQHRQGQVVRSAPGVRQSRAAIRQSCRRPRLGARRHARSAVADGGADAGMQRQQKLARRPIGAVDGEGPGQPVGLGPDFRTVALHAGFDNRHARFVPGRR